MGVLILRIYLVVLTVVISLYAIRHFIFSFNRVFGEQKLGYQDVLDSDLPTVSVLIPMHNEEKVAGNVLNALLNVDYPHEKLEIIPIDDNSSDGTRKILESYAEKYPNLIHPVFRDSSAVRGKPSSLNDAIKVANDEIIIVFDADYIPSKGLVRDLVVSFLDPEIGAVMGRVIPLNVSKNLLTRLIELERSGGYQVDQQARYNLGLIPQYGGTVGGFRRELILKFGGFDPKVLAEDTELTIRTYVSHKKVAYMNRAECYEESPETWDARARQIRRWSRGHNQVMFKYLLPLIKSPFLSVKEKVDGVFLLCIYLVPPLILFGPIDSIILFFLGEIQILRGALVFLLLSAYTTFGLFAPFYEIGLGAFLDGGTYRLFLLPFLLFNFFFNMWYSSLGFFDSILDIITKRNPTWHKTQRFRNGGDLDCCS